MERKHRKIDVRIDNHGSVFVFRTFTDAAKLWVNENVSVEGWQWVYGGFAVDHRYAPTLASGMLNDGLEVR